MHVVDSGRAIIRSKPIITSDELGGFGDPARGWNLPQLGGQANELRGFNVSNPPANSSTAFWTIVKAC